MACIIHNIVFPYCSKFFTLLFIDQQFYTITKAKLCCYQEADEDNLYDDRQKLRENCGQMSNFHNT